MWLAERAYFRRRGWLAWHVAMLVRTDAQRFPALEEMMGESLRPRPPQSPETILHNLQLHAAAQNAREASCPEH